MNELIGVVLAGGRGRRLGALGDSYAKALLPVGNEPIVGHHLRLFHQLGIRSVLVVVGHRAGQIEEALGDGDRYGMSLRYIHQTQALGSAHAVNSIRRYIRGPFLMVLGDYYFVPRDPERVVERLERGESTIAIKPEPNEELVREACAVETSADGRVTNIQEKPVRPKTNLKGCGFYAMVPEFLEAVARTPRTALRDEYELTDSLHTFVKSGRPLYSEDLICWDNNVTRPGDLLQCNLEWLANKKLEALVSEQSTVDPATEVRRTLVGDGAQIQGYSRLDEVVVFPGVRSTATGELRRALLTPQGPIDLADFFAQPAG